MKIKFLLVSILFVMVITGCGNQIEPPILKSVKEGQYITSTIEYKFDNQEYEVHLPEVGIYKTKDLVVDLKTPVANSSVLEAKSDGSIVLHITKESDITIGYESYSKANRRKANDLSWSLDGEHLKSTK